MSAVDEILSSVDLGQLAQQVGSDPAEVEQAARAALPALLGGLQANAADPAGAASLPEALGQHDGSLVDGGVDLSQVDTGRRRDRSPSTSSATTRSRWSTSSAGSAAASRKGIVAKLLPILAPIVLSWLAKQVFGGGGPGARWRPGAGGRRRGRWARRHPRPGAGRRDAGRPERRGWREHRLDHQRRAGWAPRRRPPLTQLRRAVSWW